MFSVTIPLFLLSLAPTLTLADQCSVCTGFDVSAPIDMDSIMSSFGGLGDDSTSSEDNDTNRKRFLQDDFTDITSCGDLKPVIEATSDDTECGLYSVLAFTFCGCTDAPPADSCYSCPFGGTFDKDLVPELDFGNDDDGLSLTGTCGNIAVTLSIFDLIFGAFTDGFDEAGNGLENTTGGGDDGGGNGNGEVDDSESYDDTDIDLCGLVQSSCGCNPNPDACMICENGVENPDTTFVPEEESTSMTCGDGLARYQSIADTVDKDTDFCAEGQDEFKSQGCICKAAVAGKSKKSKDQKSKKSKDKKSKKSKKHEEHHA